MHLTRSIFPAAALLAGLFADHSSAQSFTFNYSQSQTAFTNSLDPTPVPYTETFTRPVSSQAANTVSFSGPGTAPNNHFQYDLTAAGGTFFTGDAFGTYNDLRRLTLTTTSGNINAIGGNFFVTDLDNIFLPGRTIRITVTNAANVSAFQDIVPTSTNDFLSIYSPNSFITSLEMSVSAQDDFNTLDNLVVGVSPVPEPSLILAGVAGMALVVGRVRRRFGPALAT
jgi:hypothetical protein